MELVSKEDSYAERRELFKNIWQAAMQIDEKDDIIKQPKIIKTLRLDDMDKYVVGKSKKERIKTLRAVCKKILDFCDRQDEDEVLLEQVIGGQELPAEKNSNKLKKTKFRRTKKKIKRVKSLFASTNINTSSIATKAAKLDKQNDVIQSSHLRSLAISGNVESPLRFNRTSVMRRALVTNYNTTLKVEQLANKKRRKLVRKRRVKTKQSPKIESAPAVPTNISDI